MFNHPVNITAVGCIYVVQVYKFDRLLGGWIFPGVDLAVAVHEIETAGAIVVARREIPPTGPG
jgi:hypothetical protein